MMLFFNVLLIFFFCEFSVICPVPLISLSLLTCLPPLQSPCQKEKKNLIIEAILGDNVAYSMCHTVYPFVQISLLANDHYNE